MSLRVGFGATIWAQGQAHHELDGIGYYTQCLALELRAQQLDCVPVVFGEANPALNAVSPFARNLQCEAAYKWAALQSAITGRSFAMTQALKSKVNLFHATDHHIPKLKGIPVLATLMDAIPLSHPEWVSANLRWLKNTLWKKSAQWADHIITISEFSKTEIVKHFGVPSERISVIPLGVDRQYSQALAPSVIQQALQKFNVQRPFFLCIGTLQPRKNIERAVAAFQTLPAHVQSEFDLIIVGRNGWGVEPLIAQLLNQPANSHIKWLGSVGQTDKLALLQAATSLVFPSLLEGFGLPLLEAFASGTPVISSNTSSLPEVSAGAALEVDPTNTDALMQAMLNVAEQSALRAQLIEKGRLRAQQFTWQTCAEGTAAIYRQMA